MTANGRTPAAILPNGDQPARDELVIWTGGATEQVRPGSPAEPAPSGAQPTGAKAAEPGLAVDQKSHAPSYPGQPGDAPNGAVARRRRAFRRVATRRTARLRQHLDVAEPTSGVASGPVDKVASGQGISAFFGRLLDQLSLSAWFPAAMLVGSLAVLLQLRTQPNRSLAEAVTKLGNRPLGLLILLVFALVLATMVTQAFEFEVIRLLEGYWGNGLVAKAISRPFVSWQRRKYDRLRRKRRELMLRAFQRTKPDLLSKRIVQPDKTYITSLIEEDLKAQVSGHYPAPPTGWRAKKRAREAKAFEWQPFAPADLMGRIQAVEERIDEYPELCRFLPTKLGNVLRSAEDSIDARGSDLESFVVRHWDEIPSALRKEHDQYRTRLDMYCMLVFIFFVLGVVAPALITRGSSYVTGTVATSVAYLFMSFVSYNAAVASARGFRTALKAIGARDYSDQARPRRLGRS